MMQYGYKYEPIQMLYRKCWLSACSIWHYYMYRLQQNCDKAAISTYAFENPFFSGFEMGHSGMSPSLGGVLNQPYVIGL